jgi:hypothetical protein
MSDPLAVSQGRCFDHVQWNVLGIDVFETQIMRRATRELSSQSILQYRDSVITRLMCLMVRNAEMMMPLLLENPNPASERKCMHAEH